MFPVELARLLWQIYNSGVKVFRQQQINLTPPHNPLPLLLLHLIKKTNSELVLLHKSCPSPHRKYTYACSHSLVCTVLRKRKVCALLHTCVRMCVFYRVHVCVHACVFVCLAALWLTEGGQDIFLKPQALCVVVILFDEEVSIFPLPPSFLFFPSLVPVRYSLKMSPLLPQIDKKAGSMHFIPPACNHQCVLPSASPPPPTRNNINFS